MLLVFIKPRLRSGREDNRRISNASPRFPFVSKSRSPQGRIRGCSHFLNPGQCLVRMSARMPQRWDLCCFLFSLNPDSGLVGRITVESPMRVQGCLLCLSYEILNEGPQLFVFPKPGPMPSQDANHGSPKVGPELLPVFIKPKLTFG